MNRNTRNAFIRQMLQNETSIEPSPEFSYNALIKSRQDYDAMYSRSIADPEAFWADMATEHLDWFKPWDAVEEYDFDSDEPFVRYFRGGELNASCNCIDRHLERRDAAVRRLARGCGGAHEQTETDVRRLIGPGDAQ